MSPCSCSFWSSDDAHTLLEDRTYIEQMKADILRRAEEISDSEDEDEGDPANDNDKGRGRAIAFEEELDDDNAIRVQDGGSSDEEEGSNGEDSGGVGVSSNPGSSRDHMLRMRILTGEFVDPSQPRDRARTRVHPGPEGVRTRRADTPEQGACGPQGTDRMGRRADRGMEDYARTRCAYHAAWCQCVYTTRSRAS